MVIYPQSPALTAERLHLYFIGDAAMTPDCAATRTDIIERWRAINLEDIGITERLQRGRASPGFDGGRLSPVQDFGSHHFMRTVARCMTAG
jgi:choline monooxygenase